MSPPAATYRFYDVTLRLRASREEVVRDFDATYGAFRGEGTDGIECAIDTDAQGRGRVIAGGRAIAVPMGDAGSAYAKWIVFEAAAAASRTHLFLHASSVIVRGEAVLLVAPTGHGKSTLARALAAVGAESHNDDVTPLSLASRHAECFPKEQPQADGWQQRSFPVRALFFLSPRDSTPMLRLAIDRLPEGLDAVEGLTFQARGDHQEVTVDRRWPRANDGLREWCESAGVTILQDLSAAEPLFAAEPMARPCAPHRAVGWLSANTFGRAGRSPGELAWELLGAVRDAELWELVPGKRAATAEVVLKALERTPK